MGRTAEVVALSSSIRTDGGCPVVQVNDLIPFPHQSDVAI